MKQYTVIAPFLGAFFVRTAAKGVRLQKMLA